MSLILQPNLDDPDAIYEKLIAVLESKQGEDAMRLSARLILLLVNHIGDKSIIDEAIDRAAQSSETRS